MLRNKYSNQTPDTLSLFCSDFTHLVTRFSYNLRNTTKVILEPTYVQFESGSCQVCANAKYTGAGSGVDKIRKRDVVSSSSWWEEEGREGKRREEVGREDGREC